MQSPAARPMEGRRLGEFVLREAIGQGGFASVYRAEQAGLSRVVAVKVLRRVPGRGSDLATRFVREVELATRLDHPYAAHVYACGAEPDGLLWIAMELVRGLRLDDLLAIQGPLEPSRFAPFVSRLAEVLHTAHEQGIVHGDITPGNIMVIARAGRLLPKLLDFGIARALSASGADAEPRVDRGGPIGSPPYMAPELWAGHGDRDRSGDVYALAAVSYEAVTGRRAFHGVDAHEVARAHVRGVHPVGSGLPNALDDVFARALAREPHDRYPDALALSAALSTACGLRSTREELPQLPAALVDDWMARGPQPIADSLACLQAAVNPHQARDAAWRVVRVVVRVLGIVALSSHARARGGDDVPALAADLLVQLRDGGLADADWLALAVALCGPFAGAREAHPMPELVDALAIEQSVAATPAREALAERDRQDRAPVATEDDARRYLVSALAVTGRLLASVHFLLDYPLLVGRGDHAERWTGPRRVNRPVVLGPGPAYPVDRPLIADGDGCPVLALWPLCQVAPPTADAADELFLLEGAGRYGARLVALPRGLELDDARVWPWIRDHILPLENAAEGDRVERAPYRGLAAFSTEDADLYFGREREARQVANRLREHSLIVVVGPSGAGKSSFVHAGVVPALPPSWEVCAMRPGATPAVALGAQRAAVAGASETIVLVVDQLEELFTLCRDDAERGRFARELATRLAEPAGRYRVIATIRDDFLMRAAQLEALGGALAHAVHLLAEPSRDDLVRALEQPARRVGYRPDDERLFADMVDAVVGKPVALPLLSFAGAQLWQLRDRQFRRLLRRVYDGMGGVEGALAGHAEATLSAMSARQQRCARAAFRHLVTREGTRALVTRAELAQILGTDPAAGAIVERLVAARLLVAFEDDEGRDRVEIVHESLLATWPRLARWLAEDAEGAKLREQLRESARQWHERGRPRGLLWRDDALGDYRRWRARDDRALTNVEREFAAASLAEAARGRRLRRLAVGAILASLAIGLAVAVWQQRRTAAQRARAEAASAESEARQTTLYEQQGRQLLRDDDSLRALAFLAKARSRGADSIALRWLIARAARPLELQVARLDGHAGPVRSVAASPLGDRVVTSSEDGTARVWDAQSGDALGTLSGHGGAVTRARYSRDGRWIATASDDGTARLWDAGTARPTVTLTGHRGHVTAVEFSPDDALVLTASMDGTARLWDARTGTAVRVLAGHTAGVASAHFDTAGRRVVTASWDGTARIWDVGSGRAGRVLSGHDGPVGSARFDAGGTRIVTAGAAGTARVWDARTGRDELSLVGHTGRVVDAVFSPDGARVLTAGQDGSARVWDAGNGRLVFVLAGHDGFVTTAAFDRAGRHIVTSGEDGRARRWDALSGQLLATLVGHTGPVHDAIALPGGDRIATAGGDHTVRLWRAGGGNVIGSTTVAGARAAGRSDDGARIAIAGGRELVVLDTATASIVFRRPGRDWVDVALDARGHTLAAARAGGTDVFALGGDRPRVQLETGPVESIDLSADGALLVSADRASGTRLWTVGAPAAAVAPPVVLGDDGAVVAALSSTGRDVVSVARDGRARWSQPGRATSTLLESGERVDQVVFSPDGEHAVASGAIRTTVYDRTGRTVASFRGRLASAGRDEFGRSGHRMLLVTDGGAVVARVDGGGASTHLGEHSSPVLAASFASHGALVATAARSRWVDVWETHTGRLVGRVGPTPGIVVGVWFAGAGDRLVTVDAGGVVTVWNMAVDARSARQLTPWVRCRVPYRVVDGRLSVVGGARSSCGDDPPDGLKRP